MSRVVKLLNGARRGLEAYEKIMESEGCCFFEEEEIYGRQEGNVLAFGDNIEYMEYLLKEKKMAGQLQLIYVDPPFFSNGKYQASVRMESEILGKSPVIKAGAYEDCWDGDLEEYLFMLAVRFYMMRELLSDTGCIWVHLDWHGSHYVKMLMDEIFGEENFVNEVIWTYKSGGASKRSFAKKHDTLLFYSKTKKYKFKPAKEKSYNRGFKPYRFKGVKEYEDEIGWYTLVNMKDVWTIDMVGRTSAERTGYATQKPEKLLERIIEACSDEGDICADFFSGSGTLGAVAGRLGRRWLMCDEGKVAIAGQIKRLDNMVVKRKRPEEGCDICQCDFREEMGGLHLDHYVPGPLELNIYDEEVARKYIEKDCLSAVDYWSVDYSYDGKVHRAEQRCIGRDFALAKGENIHIVGYDIFGNRFTWERNCDE